MPVIPKRIEVHGRRWFRKTYGGTYHTVRIIVDGKTVHVTPQQYGYDRQYEWTAREWLKYAGYLPGIIDHESGSGEPLWRYCERVGCEFLSTVEDVRRERDLHRLSKQELEALQKIQDEHVKKQRHRISAHTTPHGRCQTGICIEHMQDPDVEPCS